MKANWNDHLLDLAFRQCKLNLGYCRFHDAIRYNIFDVFLVNYPVLLLRCFAKYILFNYNDLYDLGGYLANAI